MMGTDNKSYSYLLEREAVRRWLAETREGRHAVENMKKEGGQAAVSRVLDDDRWVSWGDMLEEHREDLSLAANCAEARNTIDLARKSNSLSAPPTPTAARWLRFFSPPLWYVLRKQVDNMDPDYWNDPKNMLREALANPQWAIISADFLRGELDKYLGSPRAETVPLSNPSPTP